MEPPIIEPDPLHPIIERAWEYRITGLNFQIPLDESPPFLDLTLRKDQVVRQLRFFHPRDLSIEPGFPTPTHGMLISDVRARQMEGIGVRVHDFEATTGSVCFWASDVVELDGAPPENA